MFEKTHSDLLTVCEGMGEEKKLQALGWAGQEARREPSRHKVPLLGKVKWEKANYLPIQYITSLSKTPNGQTNEPVLTSCLPHTHLPPRSRTAVSGDLPPPPS